MKGENPLGSGLWCIFGLGDHHRDARCPFPQLGLVGAGGLREVRHRRVQVHEARGVLLRRQNRSRPSPSDDWGELGAGLARVADGCDASAPLAEPAPHTGERHDTAGLDAEHDARGYHGGDLQRGDVVFLDEEVRGDPGHGQVLAQAERRAKARRPDGALGVLDLGCEVLGVRFLAADPGDVKPPASDLHDEDAELGNQRDRRDRGRQAEGNPHGDHDRRHGRGDALDGTLGVGGDRQEHGRVAGVVEDLPETPKGRPGLAGHERHDDRLGARPVPVEQVQRGEQEHRRDAARDGAGEDDVARGRHDRERHPEGGIRR